MLMGLYHISEILNELYYKKAQEDLALIELEGFFNPDNSDRIPELSALVELGAVTIGDIEMANEKYLMNTLWRN